MKRVIVRFIEGNEETIVLHPVDSMKRKRELAGKDWVDDEIAMEYECWLAMKRSGAKSPERSSSYSRKKPSTSRSLKSASATKS